MDKNFIEKSKIIHKFYKKNFWEGAFDENQPDTARHYNMLSSSLAFFNLIKPESVLTIGDNLARDAGYIKKQIGCFVAASDLDTSNLFKAKLKRFVDDIFDVDIEKIPFDDNFFDVVFAKESYHHWPRPNLGVYEMLRVAKKAVILIEPYDVMHANAKPYIETNDFHDDYEEAGNYKYQISLREIIKMAWALKLPAVGAKGFNDPYAPDRSFEDWLREKQKLDELGSIGERQYNLMAICIFKENLKFETLKETNLKVYHRPKDKFEGDELNQVI
jgi:SAM-dependent methyltransferase